MTDHEFEFEAGKAVGKLVVKGAISLQMTLLDIVPNVALEAWTEGFLSICEEQKKVKLAFQLGQLAELRKRKDAEVQRRRFANE